MPDDARTYPRSRKSMLEDRLFELSERLDSIESELATHTDPDWEELAVIREGDEVLEATGIVSQAEIARIRFALKRIEDGTYGRCVQCGEAISDARLDALPWTPFCWTCAP